MGNALIARRISLDNKKYWVWLAQVFGPTNHRLWDLTKGYDDVFSFYNALIDGNVKGLSDKEVKSVKTTHIEQAEKMIEYCNNNNMKIIDYDNEEYPTRLKEIYNPPSVLFCYGELSYIDDSVVLGVVGAREPSEYGIKVAEAICTELAKVGTVLVSGFAYGIDSIAHKCALMNHSKTVAVLGCGLDYDYPSDNAKLKRVLAKGGAVITEYFPGTKPVQDYFRQRNRLISGLSLGVLVVEASSKSGSLNTASHALQQGRDIFCVPPHDIFSERFSGVISLLRDGAIPVFSHLDIMYEYYENFSHKEKENAFLEDYLIKNNDSPRLKSIKISNINSKSNMNQQEETIKTDSIDYSQLSQTQMKIINMLNEGTFHIDEISQKLEIDISALMTELVELELDGKIKALAGKRYSL